MSKTLVLTLCLALAAAPLAFAQDSGAEKPTAPPKAGDANNENPPPSYELSKDADLEETLAFIQQLKDYQPTDRDSALTHRRKLSVILQGVYEKLVGLAEDAGKTDHPEYLDAKRSLLQSHLSKATQDGPKEARAALADVLAFIESRKELSASDSRMAVYAGYYFLRADDDSDDAQKIFANIVKALDASDNEQIKQDAERVAGLARRAVLIGSTVDIAGSKLDGTPFDLKSLRGKVVLVDFWATWCGPCLREHPNIEANYEKYHERGFEVVGISLDKDRARLEAHVKQNETPWIILHDEGGKSDAATHYGVFGIPSMFLIDADGKVVSTTARGPRLGEELEKLLPGKEKDAESNEAKSDTTEK